MNEQEQSPKCAPVPAKPPGDVLQNLPSLSGPARGLLGDHASTKRSPCALSSLRGRRLCVSKVLWPPQRPGLETNTASTGGREGVETRKWCTQRERVERIIARFAAVVLRL